MSRLLDEITAILQLADSKKVTDKKKCISELLELYENKEAIKEINKFSEENSDATYTWWNILTIVHKLILWEADRFSTKDVNKANNKKENTCVLLLNTIHRSHESRILTLKCKGLIQLVLEILVNKKYLSYCDTYLTILITYILPTRLYQINIHSDQWRDLLNVCINLYEEAFTSINKCKIIEAIQMIIQHGYVYSNLLLEIKKLLPLLANILSDDNSLEQIEEPIYKLANTVFYQVASENRIMLCQFGEDILPKIINLSNYDEKYKLMLLIVKIHHPKGVHQKDDGAFAYNWDTWKEILWNMYRMILRDSKKGVLLFKHFLPFASEVLNQVLQNPGTSWGKQCSLDLYSPPTKQRCIAINSPIDMIDHDDLEEAWPMIQILTLLFAKYPKRVQLDELIPLLKILNTYLTCSCKNVKIIDSLYEMCTVLMKIEQLYLNVSEKIDSTNTYWYNIWDIVVRSLNTDQCEASAHRLVQCFITYGKMRNADSLFTLYTSQAIRWSPTSLQTLIMCCEHVPLLDDTTIFNTNLHSSMLDTHSAKLHFIEWLLNTPWFKVSSTKLIESLCNILIGIPASSYHEKNTLESSLVIPIYENNHLQDFYDDSELISYESIEMCNLATTFHTNLFIKSTTKTYDSQEYLQQSFAKANVNMVDLKNILVVLKKSLYEIVNKKEENNDIRAVILKIALVGKVITTVKKMNILVEDAEINSIMCVIENCLQHSYSLLDTVDRFMNNHLYLMDLTNAFFTLYETFGHTYTDMTKIIISLTSAEKISKLFDLLNIEDSNNYTYHEIRRYNDNFNIFKNRNEYSEGQTTYKCNDISSLNAIKIQTMRTLTVFCCMNTEKEKYKIQLDLMKNLMTIDNYDFECAIDFKMAMIVLESFPQYDKEMLYEKYKDTPLLFLLELFKRCKNDQRYMRCILKIFPYFIKYAAIHNYDLISIMNELYDFSKLLCKNKFGLLVHVEFLRYLSTIIEIKPLLMKHKQYTHYQDKLWLIIENLLTYIQNSLYVLRLLALDCIQKLFSSKNVEDKHKVLFFDKLKKAAINLLSIKTKLYHNEKADEIETRTASVLLLFSTIICSSNTLQNSALITILQFINDEYITLEAAQKVLHCITNQVEHMLFNKDNLASMLTYWLNTDHTIQTFPWVLTQCASQNEFYRTHINTLVFVEIQNFNITNAKQLCIYAEYLFEDVFENIFALVLSWLLSLICQKTEQNSFQAKRAVNMLYELKLNQGNFKSIKSFLDLFEADFDKVIVNTVLKLHDEEHFYQMFQLRYQFPCTNSNIINKTDIDSCLQYIQEHFMSSKPFPQYLAIKGISKLQKILLNLVNNIYDMKFIEHKLKALHQYIYFCTILMKELQFDYFNTASMYLIREISYTLIHIIKSDIDTLSEAACKYFYIFLTHILPTRSIEVKSHLNYYVTNLVPVAQSGKISVALNILEYLIIDQKELLSDAIAKLNIFPSAPKFQQIWKVHNDLKYSNGNIYNLEKEIRHFLDITNENINSNLESLSFLKLQLSSRRNELQEMYNRLDSDPMGNYNLLHQLVCKLLEIVRSSDQNISLEAAKCLGQLGPIDLGTTILRHRKNNPKENLEASDTLTYDVITLLTDFLVDNNIRLRMVSANALNMILSSSWGKKIVNKMNCKPMLQTSMDCSRLPLRIEYISPFIYESKNIKEKKIILNRVSCSEYINTNNPIWTEKSCNSYNEWIIQITCNIIECFSQYFLEDLIPVCKLSTEMCELILPRILFLIMYLNEELVITMCHCINRFFYYHFNGTDQSMHGLPHKSQSTVNCDRNTVCFMLNLVNFIRTQASENIPLELNFIYIAKAAQYCSAYFTAFLYAEMSCESLLTKPHDFSNIPKIDYVCECEPTLGRMMQDILRDACSKIGDPDAIRGCGSSHLQDSSSRVQHYIQMQEWDKVLLMKDIELSFGNKTAVGEMIYSLQQLGFHYLLGHYISTTSVCTKEMNNDIQLECAWRLSNWDIPVFRQMMHSLCKNKKELQLSGFDYHFYHFYALKCFHERDELGVKNAIKYAQMCIVKILSSINLECNKEIYEKLMQLQMLSEIEELCFTKSDDYPKVLEKWQQCNIANLNDFQYTEPILTQRSIMYQINDALCNNSIIKTELVNTYVEIAEIAQNQGHLQIAARALGTLAKQIKLPSKFRDLLDYQESLLAWKRKDYEVGRYLLRNLIRRESINPILQARVLRIYGNWMAEKKSENPQTVIEKYYQESIKTSESIENKTPDAIKNLHDTQVALARFADAHFENIQVYMKSSQFKYLKRSVEYSCSAIKCDSACSEDIDLQKAVFLSQKQCTNDAAELQNIEREKGNYLLIAVRYYLLTLCQSEDYNLLVFRLIALWLDNAKNTEVNKLLDSNLDSIPSFKFIPLIPQLAAHMSNVLDDFSVKVNRTLMRCALDHPHHTLPVLLALKNLYGDYKFLKKKKNPRLEDEPRILGAKALLTQLDASRIASNIREMEKLSHSLVMLANYEANECKRGNKCKIPAGQQILKIEHFCNIFVPTLEVNVKCSGNYDNIIGIYKYMDTFENVGGINAPKKIVCIGTDGIKREQLLKGKDDLRQDGVMQQVFSVMNRLFQTKKEAKRRKLKIRTYKVVPLTQRSGILEWCHNTMPIAMILIGPNGTSGLHKKYNPRDYTAAMCCKKIESVSKKSNEVKLEQFLECCKHMRPAFHHFFIEKYPSPETWFEKRLAYTRSVATTSIAGYILGLGDRHLNNILIDQLTAEVIHIDFGIAFEQGKVLRVPETVPFRLTRDLEAAMGVSGIEGIMRRGCEEILTVLRDQRQIIITLLQVLLYDPLFTWAITPAKAYSFQSGNAAISSEDVEVHGKTNKTAERALLRIEQKLQGIEEGLVFSIPGQVEQLIQQARDPSNLSRLYCGWQAYL